MRITIAQGAFLPVPPKRGGAIEKAFHALAREFAANGHYCELYLKTLRWSSHRAN